MQAAPAAQDKRTGAHFQEEGRYGGGASPVQGRPVAVGNPVLAGGHSPHLVAIQPDLPPAEVVVLNYRLALVCFATIDIVTSVLNIFSRDHGILMGLYGLIFLLGPICGLLGARMLNRNLIAVYVAICIFKAAFQVALAVLVLLAGLVIAFIWLALIALVQVWIAKIVFELWRALGAIHPDRRRQLAEGKVYSNAPIRMVYW